MKTETTAAFVWIGFWLALLLYSEAKNWSRGLWVSKPLASIGLLLLSLTLNPTPFAETETMLLVGAIGFCVLGDVLLIPLSEKIFLLGISSFALGHLGYLATFVVHGQNTEARSLLVAIPVILGISFLITRFLWNKIPKLLRPAVLGYVVLISGLVLSAWRISAEPNGNLLLLGAIAFYVSDISVALDRFVERKFIYRAWGLPLYYTAQVLLILGLLN